MLAEVFNRKQPFESRIHIYIYYKPAFLQMYKTSQDSSVMSIITKMLRRRIGYNERRINLAIQGLLPKIKSLQVISQVLERKKKQAAKSSIFYCNNHKISEIQEIMTRL